MSTTIGLSMIVKDAEPDLRFCLASVRGLVDQIVIADTGSTDGTIAIAREFGATIVNYPWTDHYAEARNFALAPVTTDWVLVLDADEELSEKTRIAIPGLLNNSPGTAGYTVTFRNYLKDRYTGMLGSLSRENQDTHERAKSAPSYAEHSNCRLFRRDPRIFFSGRIHEGVEPQIVAAGLQYQPSGLDILHFGYLAEEQRWAAKQDDYHRITATAVHEEPKNTHLWLQMGISEIKTRKNMKAALECFQVAVSIDPTCYDAWRSIGILHKARREYVPAIKAYAHLPIAGDYGISRAKALGEISDALGEPATARAMYTQALALVRADENALSVGLEAELEYKLSQLDESMKALNPHPGPQN